MEEQDSPNSIEKDIKSWLDDNGFVVEMWQMEEKMASCGAKGYQMTEMEGGFSSLDATAGMGNVIAPQGPGTNANFYNDAYQGSGDKFTTLTVGTPAAKSKKKKSDKRVKVFSDFIKMMKASQSK